MARRNSSLISSKIQLEPNTVDAAALTNDSIDADKLADNSVDEAALQDGSVSQAKLGGDVQLGATTGKAIAMLIVFG